MAQEVSFQIRIETKATKKSRNVTLAELGVLLTGINRALNKAVGNSSRKGYSPLGQEPLGVQSEIVRVDNGSVLLSVVTSASDFAANNPLTTAFLTGIFGNAVYDFSKVLSKEIASALRRIGSKVQVESERIEPVFKTELSLDVDEAGHQIKALQSNRAPQQVRVIDGRAIHSRTVYTVTLEQEGNTIIEISYSANDRD